MEKMALNDDKYILTQFNSQKNDIYMLYYSLTLKRW